MWAEFTRRKHERERQRYASDLTDAEWALIGSSAVFGVSAALLTASIGELALGHHSETYIGSAVIGLSVSLAARILLSVSEGRRQ